MLGHPVAGVWPRDYMEKVGHEAFRNKPIGTGPYMVDRWVHGEYVDLVKNPDYWDPEHAGYVDRIHMPIMDVDDAVAGVPEGSDRLHLGAQATRSTRRETIPRCGTARGVPRAWPQLCLILVGHEPEEPACRRPCEPPAPPGPELLRRSRRRDRRQGPDASDQPPQGWSPTASLTTIPAALPILPTLRRPNSSSSRSPPCPPSATCPSRRRAGSSQGFSNLEAPLLSGWRSVGLDVTLEGLRVELLDP